MKIIHWIGIIAGETLQKRISVNLNMLIERVWKMKPRERKKLTNV